MTLISEYHSGGSRRRCDAKCHNGKHTKCKCICGGKNHGVGLKRAIENTREMAGSLLARDDIKIGHAVMQDAIFE